MTIKMIVNLRIEIMSVRSMKTIKKAKIRSY